MIPLINHDFQGRSEVVMKFTQIYIIMCMYISMYASPVWSSIC